MSPLDASKKKVGVGNDVYTVLLTMAALVLVVTTGLICWAGQDMFGTFYKIIQP